MPWIDEPKLEDRVERPGTGIYASSDRGRRIRRLSRIMSDGKVFARKTTKPGSIQRGTFLIDASGSMALSKQQIEDIVHSVPGVTVAMYNSYGRSATIRIVAKGGKVMRDFPRFGGGNGCDGPALLWLSRQPGPRFWYSDAYVHGLSGDYNEMRDECFAICRASRITHINPNPAQGYDPHGMGDNCDDVVTLKTDKRKTTGLTHSQYIKAALRRANLIR
jgi:hypothetical protein